MRFAAHRLIDYWMPIDHLGRMDTTKLLLESIATRKCVETVYNRMAVKLAPHILYTRHDELFIDAVTTEREGKPPREIKIGTFKLPARPTLRSTNQRFRPKPISIPPVPKSLAFPYFPLRADIPLITPRFASFQRIHTDRQ